MGWLPHGTDKNVAKQFIEDKLKDLNDFSTESVQDEYYKDKDQPEFDKLLIKTGNFRVKVKYNKKNLVPKISGTHEIYLNEKEKNKKILIKKLGEKECYLCKQSGHIKKDCPNKENASKLFSNRVNKLDELPDDEREVEEGEDSGEKSKIQQLRQKIKVTN